MEVGDLVRFESDGLRSRLGNCTTGIVIAKHPEQGIAAASVDILWDHGELHENCVPRVLEVINESR